MNSIFSRYLEEIEIESDKETFYAKPLTKRGNRFKVCLTADSGKVHIFSSHFFLPFLANEKHIWFYYPLWILGIRMYCSVFMFPQNTKDKNTQIDETPNGMECQRFKRIGSVNICIHIKTFNRNITNALCENVLHAYVFESE